VMAVCSLWTVPVFAAGRHEPMERPMLQRGSVPALSVVAIFFGATALVLPAPALARSKHVTLAQILAHAERHAPAIRIGRSRRGLGDAEASAASLLLPEDPELEVAVGPRLSTEGWTLDLEASVQQRLEISGARGLRIRAAEQASARLQVELEETHWQVHRQVHAAFHAALVARQRVEAAGHMVGFARKLLEITKKRHAAGAISMLHVRVAEGEAAQAAQRKIRAETGYRAACLLLAEVAGWSVKKLPEPLGGLEAPRAAPPLRKLLDLARGHHPELRVRQAAVDEAKARFALAERNVFPKPAIGVAYSREAEVAGPTNHIVVATLGLSLPLWRRNRGERARTSAELEVARAQHQGLKQVLPARVARAAGTLDAAAARIAVYGREVVPAFQGSLKMIGRAYLEGKVDVLQVMVARSRFLEIQRETLDAYEDYYKAHAALEAVVGAEIWSTHQKEHK